jgi:DNA-binding response OmpR family regulator
MKDDKQKCIDAGANDYITKPIDIGRLLSLMRVWLSN